ncbi:hypothetical protein McpSp1_18090 [Methanocorpusculaceae archaeon Sp1]|nr:hypothetical protein [Methanocorpusculaceae archaeon Sp1]
MDSKNLGIEVLKYYQKYADEHGMDKFTVCTQLSNVLSVEPIQLGNAISILEQKGYLQVVSLFGISMYEAESRITAEGIEYLGSLDKPVVETAVSTFPLIAIMNSTITSSVIGTGNTVSITIADSFNAIRELPLSDDEKQIVNEMEQEANKANPSLDWILEKAKLLWKNHGTEITNEVIKIFGVLIRSQMG